MSGPTIAVLGVLLAMTSGMNIQLIPQYPITKGSVTLNVLGITQEILTFSWFKGPNTNPPNQMFTYFPTSIETKIDPIITGPKHLTRAQAFPNGSLFITDLHINDGGHYIVKVQTFRPEQQASVFLKVYEPVSKPVITASHSNINEFDALNLTCSAAKTERIIWKKDGENLQLRATVSSDYHTITFSKVNRTDAGEYQCLAENVVSKSSSDPYTLVVFYTPECSPCDTNTAVISGVACGSALIIIILIGSCFLVYKKCVRPENEEYTGSPIEKEDSYAIYDNVLIPTRTENLPEEEPAYMLPKEEPAYMVLQCVPESAYNELTR